MKKNGTNSFEVQNVISFFNSFRSQYLEDLKQLVRIPSVSFDHFDPNEVKRSAQAVASLLSEYGLENVQVLSVTGKENKMHPYVYADWLHAPGKPTLLLYAHHDVQPPGKIELWKTKPFEPTEINGRLYGRGTADDKAGVLVHAATIHSFLKVYGKLPLNVKLIIEGEEEIGSTHLAEFMKEYAHKLSADAMVLTDTQNFDVGVPALTVSLRGLIGFDIELKAHEHSMHSGMWGGPVPDPALALTKMLASCTDEQGRLSIDGIWDEVIDVNDEEKKSLDSLPLTEEEFRKQAALLHGTQLLPGRDGKVHPLKQIWREPSFAINAFEASSRKAAANIINESAWAHFGVRIVANMDPKRTEKIIRNHLERVLPWGLKMELRADIGGGAWSTNAQGKAFDCARQALEKGYGKKTLLIGCGGSIPFVEPLSKALGGVPALLIGVEDPLTNAHSENESMSIDDFYKSILSMIYFYESYSLQNS